LISAAIASSLSRARQQFGVVGFRTHAGIPQPVADGGVIHPQPLGDLALRYAQGCQRECLS
jgi:hypothetical protein